MEILVATAILVVTFGAVLMLVMGSQKLSIDTETNQEALRGAEKHLEEARATIRNNFTANVDLNAPEVIDGLTYQVTRTASTADFCARDITVRYEWSIEGRPQHIELFERISDPIVASAAGSGCDPSGPPGGGGSPWEQCQDTESLDFNPSGIQGTDLDVFKIGAIRYAFVTSTKNPATNPDLWIYNVDDISGLTDANMVVNKDIGVKELRAVQVVRDGASGNMYAYTITDETTNQVRAFDVSSLITTPLQPGTGQVASLDIPIGTAAKTLYYYGGKLYVALGTQLAIVNVSNPTLLTSYTLVNIGHTINKIMVDGNYVFLATSDDSGELKAVNLSTNAVSNFNATGNADGTSVFVSGGIAYLGRDSTGNGADFIVLDVSNPPSWSPASVFDTDDLGSNNGVLLDIVVHSGFAFIATNHPQGGFDVWNVRNPRNIFENCVNNPSLNNDNGVNVSNKPAGLDYIDNIVFATSPSNDALRVVTDPQND